MAPTEITQVGPSLPHPQPRAPPSSPNPSSSEHIVTLSNAQQLIDMVKAIVAMEIASTPVTKCTCSHTPAETPTLRGPTQPLTFEHLEQLVTKLLERKVPESTRKSEDTQALAPEANQPEDVAAQASKLEFKTIDEVWNEKAHKYTILKSLDPMGNAKEKDLYVFVVRHRVDKETKDTTTYIDIKSKYLRDILRVVLQDVRGISLKEDKLSIEQNLLYTYLPELISCHNSNNIHPADDACKQHLELLIDCITKAYADVAQHLTSLLQSGEITYDLLWALFKSNTLVYTTCSGTRKPRCVRFNFGEEKKTRTGTKYWNLNCRYLDFNGEDFGSTPIELKIPKFRRTRRINTLEAFPLQYHADVKGVRANLLACGRKFVSMIGSHHRYCRGKAFVMYEGEQVEVAVDSRIMVDAAFFRKMNPGHSMPTIDLDPAFSFDIWEQMHVISDASSETSSDMASSDASSVLASSETTFGLDSNETSPDQAESHPIELARITEEDFIICCPTVPGFSFSDKMWAEFAVADIEENVWSSLPFDSLAIADEQRDVVMALVESRNDSSVIFDDVIPGKGQGLNILLHGLAGVGKTLTAEAVAEFLEMPLYSISARELATDAAKLEAQLSRIFKIASHWNAILLLDEADVFLEKRSSDLIRNSVVSVFLRKLEYCQGIMFLTTNRIAEFDPAILSRIHVMLKYGDLTKDAATKVWELFIRNAKTSQGPANISVAELKRLVNCKLNGRQIKNVMATARALAMKEKSRVCFSHIQKTVTASKEFITEFNGGVNVSSLYA